MPSTTRPPRINASYAAHFPRDVTEERNDQAASCFQHVAPSSALPPLLVRIFCGDIFFLDVSPTLVASRESILSRFLSLRGNLSRNGERLPTWMKFFERIVREKHRARQLREAKGQGLRGTTRVIIPNLYRNMLVNLGAICGRVRARPPT